MDKVRAPYNFVPLAPQVVFPEWADVPAWDQPFEDGISGRLTLELQAHTAILVRGDRGGNFFRLADGSYAIPGSAMRGLLRNVVEIAGFGKLGRYNDHRYGVRDLHNRDLYLQYMADLMEPISGSRKQPMPLVDAGWMRKVTLPSGEVGAEILPCDFAKIHYRHLEAMAAKRGVQHFNPGGRRQAAPDKYRAWGAPKGEEEPRQVDVGIRPLRPGKGAIFLSAFGVASPGGGTKSFLVMTGQPQVWRKDDPMSRAKQHDFVFLDPAPGVQAIKVAPQAFKDFEFVHADRGQQNRMVAEEVAANPEWHFWRPVFNRGERVPVFFLRWPAGSPLAGQLRAIGLAMMFRLAYKHSIGTAIRNAQPLANSDKPDLADLIFGQVSNGGGGGDRATDGIRSHDADRTRRGRVSFGLLRAMGQPQTEQPLTDLVQGAPKASYYPNYIEQGIGKDYGDLPAMSNGRPRYYTLMDDQVRARGWKRYRPQEVTRTGKRPTKGDGSEMGVSTLTGTLVPLATGVCFEGPIRIHNLRQIELGALLWAMDFGGEENAFHTIGTARSFGYGRITLSLKDHDLRANDGRAVDLDQCRRAFCKYMDDRLIGAGGWHDSVNLRDLLALAKPIPAQSDDGRHMDLKHPHHRNEFQEAKKQGLALPPVGRPQGRAGERGAPTGGGNAGARQGSGGAPRQAPPAQQPPGGQPAQQQLWTGIAAGTKVKAKLVDQNKNGKWRVLLVDFPASGVVGLGDPPSGLEVAAIVEVVVSGGGNPMNLVLRWS